MTDNSNGVSRPPSIPASAASGPARYVVGEGDGVSTHAPLTRTLVIHPHFRDGRPGQSRSGQSRSGPAAARPARPQGAAPVRLPQARLDEAVALARAIDLDVVEAVLVPLSETRPATYIGSGKLDELAALITEREIGLVVADCELSPGQQRNLERAWDVKVIDRTGLILEIFGARAQTREGRLQVELAHLTYQKSRLVRSWTHLERQRGGFGFLGGPGETQIEVDRRMLEDRIGRLRKALDTVVRTRSLHRKARQRLPYPVIALVGYTNAGKSTLFNRITAAEVVAEDMLFATLDPTMRRIKLPSGRVAILSDTVGFVSHLPTHLVAAFRATLEEVMEADVVVHVRDIAHPDSAAQADDVVAILKDLGIEDGPDLPVIEALNKLDLLTPDEAAEIAGRATASPRAVGVSALTGEGINNLLHLVDEALSAKGELHNLVLRPGEGAALAWLYSHGRITGRDDRDDGIHLQVRLDPAAWGRFAKTYLVAADGSGRE